MTDETAAPAAAAKPPLVRRLGFAWSVAAVTTVIALLFAVMWAPLYSQDRARDRVRAAAEQLVLHLTTFEGATIDDWVQETQRRATDEYAEEVNTLFDPELRAALRDAEAKSVGRLVNLFVQDVDGDDATVFAVVRQTITNARAPQPVEDELRMQISLVREGGTWKAARVEVLGPQESGQAPAPGGGLLEEGDGS
ncbi:MAG TPA: hypothetical protein VNU01_12375 [Egibacteraceae bacterium]|nr:hypothetical protein [Egibacteraceae bacterium]